jgi:hypothetical protein
MSPVYFSISKFYLVGGKEQFACKSFETFFIDAKINKHSLSNQYTDKAINNMINFVPWSTVQCVQNVSITYCFYFIILTGWGKEHFASEPFETFLFVHK